MTAIEERSLRSRISHARAATRIGVALVASVLMLALLPRSISFEVRMVASWDGFALAALALTWTTITTLRPDQIRRLARSEDPSRFAALVLVIVGASASLLAVVVLLQTTMTMKNADKVAPVVLALSAVALAWALIHTVFTLRYAHLFYDTRDGDVALEFPGNVTEPDYFDFAYFAFVIGMTAQTADVNIRGRNIRRTALLHGVLSFGFNTAVVALSIGVLTSLL